MALVYNHYFPTINFFFLVPAPLWCLICTNYNSGVEKKHLSIIIKKIDDGTATSYGTTWNKFSDKHQNQSIK